MLRKLILALSAAFLACAPAHAQTGSAKSSAALTTETNTLWPDNAVGGITPFNARQTLLDIIASYPNISSGNIFSAPVVASTSAVARSLNVGSNFAAAQPAEFNINDNQAPADSRFCYLGASIPGGVANGGFINATCGTSSNPVNWAAGSLSVFAGVFDAGVGGRSYNGEWHNYSMTSGTGGGVQSLLVYCTLGGTWTPSGAAGCVGANTYANTTVGGFTWGMTPAAAASGTTAANIVGTEINTQYAAGAGGSKVGLQVVDQLNNATGTSTVAAANTAIQVVRVHTTYGWDTGLLFPAGDGSTVDYPIRTTGTLIKSAAGTFAHGIDLSAGTCSTDCFKSKGYAVDGSGNITGLYDTGGAGNTFKIAGTAAGTVAQIQSVVNGGQIRYVFKNVNFNSANTDTALTFTLPTGITRYAVNALRISNASASISTATCGLFTAAGGGGTAIAATQAITVTATAADVANNTMLLTGINSSTNAYNDTTLQFRVTTAQGSAATADVILYIVPLS